MAPIFRILSSYVSRKVRRFSRALDRDVVGSEKVDLDNGCWSGEDLRRMIFWRLGLSLLLRKMFGKFERIGMEILVKFPNVY